MFVGLDSNASAFQFLLDQESIGARRSKSI
jgi:hypothetical protein